jgi:hypothetical protein
VTAVTSFESRHVHRSSQVCTSGALPSPPTQCADRGRATTPPPPRRGPNCGRLTDANVLPQAERLEGTLPALLTRPWLEAPSSAGASFRSQPTHGIDRYASRRTLPQSTDRHRPINPNLSSTRVPSADPLRNSGNISLRRRKLKARTHLPR